MVSTNINVNTDHTIHQQELTTSKIIDWHSHILPGIDDGSKNVDESISLINALKSQGVSIAVATPHFYPHRESLDSFLKRRERAINEIHPFLKQSDLKVLYAAEVYYYRGISRLEQIKDLCIEGSNLILIEMPYGKWSESVVEELAELSGSGQVKPIMAHVERYIFDQCPQIFHKLLNCGILMQINASFLINRRTRNKAISLMKKNMLHLIGSDCHNMSDRYPQIGEAFFVAEHMLGKSFTENNYRFGSSLLNIR